MPASTKIGELQRQIDLNLFSLEAALDQPGMEYTDVFRQGLGEWSPNGKFLAGAQQPLGFVWQGRSDLRASPHGNVYAISLQIRVCIQMHVQMHVYVLFTYIGRNEGIKE